MGTGAAFSGAAVVGVVSATWFVVLLGGDGAAAAGADHQAGVREEMFLGARTMAAAEKGLHPVEFVFRNHGWVRAGIDFQRAVNAALNQSVVKGGGEDFVQAREVELASAETFEAPGAVAPFFVGRADDLRHGVLSSEHQVPHPAHERKAFGVGYNGVVRDVVEVALGSQARIAPAFQLGPVAALDVLGQVVNVFLRHAEFNVHHDGVVLGRAVGLRGRENLEAVLFHGPDDGAAIHRVAGQAIQFPAENALDLAV